MSNSINSLSSTPLPNPTTIDDLPEPLVVHILSFLYIQDAIRASLVSRRFRNLWHLMPSLSFDIAEFYSRPTSRNLRSYEYRQLFAEFVYHTLFLRPPYPLTKFILKFEYKNNGKHKYYVDNWIRYAIDLCVSQLILVFDQYNALTLGNGGFDGREFDFHLLDIRKSCIKVLKLYLCRLILPPKTNSIKFVSLKTLELDVHLVGDNDIGDLLALCVNLETLRLEGMSFLMTGVLRIHSASLKELYLDSNSSDKIYYGICLEVVDICCPSLQKIGLINLNFDKYIIKGTTLLVEACVDCFFKDEKYNKSWEKMLSCFTNVSSLHLWHELLASNEVPVGCEQILSNVKHLELYCDYNEDDLLCVATLLKLLPKLQTLELHNRDTANEKLHQDDLPSTVFNMPCLRKVILSKYQETKREQHFITLFRKSGIVLEKIELLHAPNPWLHIVSPPLNFMQS